MRHPIADGRIQAELHSYYVQHCRCVNRYCRTEVIVALSYADRVEPWGKIAMDSVNGDSSLTDHGRGYGMDSEMQLDDRLSFRVGVRPIENTHLGNYMMLRWPVHRRD
jgi:hypothetical protein